MPEDQIPTLYRLVQKTPDGYVVTRWDRELERFVNETKAYFHPTSAFAAMGRLQHKETVAHLELEQDPAKDPPKDKQK